MSIPVTFSHAADLVDMAYRDIFDNMGGSIKPIVTRPRPDNYIELKTAQYAIEDSAYRVRTQLLKITLAILIALTIFI